MPKSIAMAVKPAAYPDPGISGASLEQAGSAGFFEPLVRSLAGDGALNLVRAKAEVRAALLDDYGRWRRALDDLENLWALANWRSAAAQEAVEQAPGLAA